MALVNQILRTIEPTIPTRTFPLLNVDPQNEAQNNNAAVTATLADSRGAMLPMIRFVNAYTVPDDQIMEMEISQSGFLPRCRIVIWDKNHLLTNLYYPVFDPIVSVYVKSHHPSLKPLRNDFLITSINSVIQDDQSKVYYIDGELYIPRIYDNVSKSYPNVKSTDCLKAICTDLGLGYASNEETTNDVMTWINPNMSYYMFIKEEVTKRAYKDDNSFFTCFIDRYYNLNFVNVEKQMAQDSDFDQSYVIDHYVKTGAILTGSDDRTENASVQAETILSNHPSGYGTVNSIKDHKLLANNGSVLKNEAFRKQVYWYDSPQQQTLNFFIEPLSNASTLTGSEHQTPILTDLRNTQVKKWTGFELGNAHKNNKFAQALNFHNLAEMEKSTLVVTLDALNPIITLGSRVPVTIYNETYFATLKKSAMGKFDDIIDSTNYKVYIDDMLSDIYYVKEIVYNYNVFRKPDPFSTEIVLSKRNWKKQPFNQ